MKSVCYILCPLAIVAHVVTESMAQIMQMPMQYPGAAPISMQQTRLASMPGQMMSMQMPMQMSQSKLPMVMMPYRSKSMSRQRKTHRHRRYEDDSEYESESQEYRRSRNKPSRSKNKQMRRQVLTPVVSYVTKHGYVVYQKKIQQKKARDWLTFGNRAQNEDSEEIDDSAES